MKITVGWGRDRPAWSTIRHYHHGGKNTPNREISRGLGWLGGGLGEKKWIGEVGLGSNWLKRSTDQAFKRPVDHAIEAI